MNVIVDAMPKSCVCCYLLDAYVGGQVVRKKKYRRESSPTGHKWYDYDNLEVTDSSEINRLDSLALDDNLCDCVYYNDHDEFMKGMILVDGISGLPATKNHILVEWSPGNDKDDQSSTTMSFANQDVFDGDSFYIIVHNASSSNVDLYAPKGSNVVNIWGDKIEMEPDGYASVRVLYDKGVWYWEFITIQEGGSPTEDEFVILDADILVVRYYWTSENGTDLDTASEFVNSNIPGVDGNAVGWNCPGNGGAASDVIHWAGDNTSSGNECVYIDMGAIKQQYGDALPKIITMSIYGTWFNTKANGGAQVQILAYKGGTMTQDGFNFVNNGGELRYNNTHNISVSTYKGVEDYHNKYSHIADISFDILLDTISVNIM